MNWRSVSVLQTPTALILVQKKGFAFDVFIQPILKIGSLCRILIQHFICVGLEAATLQLHF